MKGLDWPPGNDRTPPDEREKNNRFSTTFRETEKDIENEMELLGASAWWLDHVSGRDATPGVVLRFEKDGDDYAVSCDRYKTKTSNARDLYHWAKETRKRMQRPSTPAGDSLAAARLPPGDDQQATPMGAGGNGVDLEMAPHEILGVEPDADDEEITQAARQKLLTTHPDQDGDAGALRQIKEARDVMLDG